MTGRTVASVQCQGVCLNIAGETTRGVNNKSKKTKTTADIRRVEKEAKREGDKKLKPAIV